MREILRDIQVRLNLASQVSHRSVAEVTMCEYLFDSALRIDLAFHCVYSRVFYGIACVRACATTVKKKRSVCIPQLSTFSFHA